MDINVFFTTFVACEKKTIFCFCLLVIHDEHLR